MKFSRTTWPWNSKTTTSCVTLSHRHRSSDTRRSCATPKSSGAKATIEKKSFPCFISIRKKGGGEYRFLLTLKGYGSQSSLPLSFHGPLPDPSDETSSHLLLGCSSLHRISFICLTLFSAAARLDRQHLGNRTMPRVGLRAVPRTIIVPGTS